MVPPTIDISVNRAYQGKLTPGHPAWKKHTASFRREQLDVQGIAAAIAAGYAITAAHHTKRDGENFISAQHIGLDFDTEDERSAIDRLLRDPFIADYAAIVHTTSSHTRRQTTGKGAVHTGPAHR